MTTPDLPPGLPPLPPNTRYAGQLRDHSGRLFAFIYCPEDPDGWEYSGEWIGMDSNPQANTADWHVAIPIEAVREPANYSGQCDACRSIYEGTKAECKARICRECIGEPAEVPASGYPLHHPQGPKDWPEDASLENGGYQNNCCNCQGVFYGHKRRVFCRECCQPASGVEAIATREWCVKSAEIEGEAEVGAGTPTGVEARVCGWRPIESIPIRSNYDFCRIAWMKRGEWHIADGMRYGEKWFAACTFYRGGRHDQRQYEFREIEVTPTHWKEHEQPPVERSDHE